MLYDTVLPGVPHAPFLCHGCGGELNSRAVPDTTAFRRALERSQEELQALLKKHHSEVRHTSPDCPLYEAHAAVIAHALDFEEAVRLEQLVRDKLIDPSPPRQSG